MSMPGFVFHFRCVHCNAHSGEYSTFAFPSTFEPHVSLPAWSTRHGFWGHFSARLTIEERKRLETNRGALLSFADSLSSESLIIGVPHFESARSGEPMVTVAPDPLCPLCGLPCQTPFGHPPERNVPAVAPTNAAEFRAVPLASVDLSVRSRMICRELGLETLGQVEDAQAAVTAHARATDSTVREIDDVLAMIPGDDRKSPR